MNRVLKFFSIAGMVSVIVMLLQRLGFFSWLVGDPDDSILYSFTKWLKRLFYVLFIVVLIKLFLSGILIEVVSSKIVSLIDLI